MIDIFLSASVPLPTRDRRFFETADVLLIREAIKALVEVVLPIGRITCGGHPAISPLLALFAQEAGAELGRLTIFQSEFFNGVMPTENKLFADVQSVPAISGNRDASLTLMRQRMVASRPFAAAVIVGGMEGIFEEVQLFARYNPQARLLPIASTGAAAGMVFMQGNFDEDLLKKLTYPSLFRRHLHPLG